MDVTLIAAPSSTKNQGGGHDPETYQFKKGHQSDLGMNAFIGADADSGLVHMVVGTATNVNDVTQAYGLLHGEETDLFNDAGYVSVAKREETQTVRAQWHVAMCPGKRRELDTAMPLGRLLDDLERTKARIRAKAEHPSRVVKRQFGHGKARYPSLMKNTQQLLTLFALTNL